MMKLKILPYRIGSSSAKLLAQHLEQLIGYKVWRVSAPRLPNSILINWGRHGFDGYNVINLPQAVSWARNKLESFKHFTQFKVPTVEWTTDRITAAQWINQKAPVYLRHTITGQGGAGIAVVETDVEFEVIPLGSTNKLAAVPALTIEIPLGLLVVSF